jgi:hypothetical protein
MKFSEWLNEQELSLLESSNPKNLDKIKNLKKGDEINITYDSSVKKGHTGTFIVKSRNMIKGGKIEKITLVNKENPNGMKYYFYDRGDNKVSFAMGNMGAVVTDIK